MKWFYLIVAIVSEVIASLALKNAEGFTKLKPSVVVVIGFASAFYFLSKTLSELKIGIAYAIWSGTGIILIAIIGYINFDQRLDPPAILGIIMILSGVLIIHIFSETSLH